MDLANEDYDAYLPSHNDPEASNKGESFKR